MAHAIGTYFSFNDGACEEALDFYAHVLDGEIGNIMRYGDLPKDVDMGEEMGTPDPNLIVHAELRVGDSVLMLSDNAMNTTESGDQVTMNYTGEDENATRRIWQRFVDAGSEVYMDLTQEFFAPLFGVLVDPYGINWQIMQSE